MRAHVRSVHRVLRCPYLTDLDLGASFCPLCANLSYRQSVRCAIYRAENFRTRLHTTLAVKCGRYAKLLAPLAFTGFLCSLLSANLSPSLAENADYARKGYAVPA